MRQCHLRVFLSTWTVIWFASPCAWASPPDSVWIEDLHLHPAGPAELSIAYDFVEPDLDLVDADIDVVTLSTAAGFDRATMDFYPSIGFAQAGISGVRLYEIGLRARYRLQGTTRNPKLALLAGYRLMLFGEHSHDMEQGVAGRIALNTAAAIGWEAKLRERVGDGNHVEARVGVAATYSVAIDLVSIGIETFALIPLTGDRLSDYGAGGDREAPALYAGPSLRAHFEYLWINGSVVTGRILDNGADYMVHVTMGTLF